MEGNIVKTRSFGLPASVFLAVSAFAGFAQAQTCASPLIFQPSPAGTPTVTDTTCNGETDMGGGFCQSAFNAPGPGFILQSTFAPNRTFSTIAFSGGSGYDLAAYVVAQANGCNTNGACQTTGDATTPLQSGDIPDGTYYIIVTAADFDAAGACGPFIVVSNGSVPVTMQSFSVE